MNASSVSFADFKACMELVNEQIRDRIPFINNGGCGVFASELIKRMYDLGIDDMYIAVFGCVYDDEIPDISEVENQISNEDFDPHSIYSWNDNGIDFAHVVIEWKGVYWDALEPFVTKTWNHVTRYNGNFDERILHSIAHDEAGWNDTYDRSNNDTVREILDEAFKLLA